MFKLDVVVVSDLLEKTQLAIVPGYVDQRGHFEHLFVCLVDVRAELEFVRVIVVELVAIAEVVIIATLHYLFY